MYDTDGDGVLTNESIDLYGYDMAWRLAVVVQYDPPSMEVAAAMLGEGDPLSENLHGRVRVRERYFYHGAGDGSAAYGTGSFGPAGSDTPMMTRHSAAGQAGGRRIKARSDFWAWLCEGDGMGTGSVMPPAEHSTIMAPRAHQAWKPSLRAWEG